MGAIVSAALAVQYYTHRMTFDFEPGRAYDVRNNGSTIVVRDDAGTIVLHEWIPYTCRPNPYAAKTMGGQIVLEFECEESSLGGSEVVVV